MKGFQHGVIVTHVKKGLHDGGITQKGKSISPASKEIEQLQNSYKKK